jgi:hypothetical protein
MKIKQLFALGLAGLMLSMVASPAWAQATRTWVSGVGDDANPCSRTAPCKTFAGAISKTAASGEIDVLDPGGFGALTITKAITIANDGVGTAGVLVSGTNGIVVSAGPTDLVILRGLDIEGLNPAPGPGLNGVNILQAGSVIIDHCKIYEFQQNGINFQPDNNGATLTVVDTVLANNGSNGGPLGNYGNALVQPVGTGVNAFASFDRVQMLNGFKPGLRVDGSETTGVTTVSVRNSNVQFSGGTGIAAQTEAPDNGVVTVTVDSSTITNNPGFGLHSTGTNSTLYMSGDTVSLNGTGVGVTTSNLISLGNNAIVGNTTNGSPTSTTALH